MRIYDYSYTYKKEMLIYEGEFFNGEETGKFKRFDNYTRSLKFEGEYLDGQRFKRKEYNCCNAEINFEGILF